MRLSRTSEKGASIAELAVAAFLVGIVLTVTLKGRVMIDIMKAQLISNQLPALQMAILQYREDYRQLPGDDPTASRMWTRQPSLSRAGEATLASLEGNSRIDGELFDFGNPSAETFVAWQDMRFAGLIEGDPQGRGSSAMPENPFGGLYGIDEGNLGQSNGSICATKVPGLAAEVVDQRLDDGKVNTGILVATSQFSIEANNHFDAPDTEPYNVEKEYIICVPLLP